MEIRAETAQNTINLQPTDTPEEEFEDMPALEEPHLAAEVVSPKSIPLDVPQPSTHSEETSEIIELTAPSEPCSIFAKKTGPKKSTDIFSDLVSDSDGSDDEDVEKPSSPKPFLIAQNKIEEISSSSQPRAKLLIEEVSNSDPTSGSNPEKLTAPAQSKKNPFLITEVHSSDISDMFFTQSDLLNDDVEQIDVADAHDEVLTVEQPSNDDFLNRIGQTFNQNNENQSELSFLNYYSFLILHELLSSWSLL